MIPVITEAKKKNNKIKKQDLDFWSQTMEFGTPAQKKAVLKQIRGIKKPEITKILLKTLKESTNLSIKQILIQILYDRNEKAAYPILVKKLEESKDSALIATAISALGKLKNKKAIPYIIKHLNHESASVVQAVIRTLGKLKAVSTGKRLLSMLTNVKTDKEVKYDLVNALGIISYKPAFKILRQIAIGKANKQYYRAFAITALGRLKNNKILPDLYRIVTTEKNLMLKYRVIEALGELGSKESLRYIKKAMTDESHQLRTFAIKSAAKLKDKRFLKILFFKLKHDKHWQVMISAAQALHKMKADGVYKIVLKKFENSMDAKILLPLLEIIKDAKSLEAKKILEKKQKDMKFSSIKDKIEKVLEKWGMDLYKIKKQLAAKKSKKNQNSKIVKKSKLKKKIPVKKNKKPVRVYIK